MFDEEMKFYSFFLELESLENIYNYWYIIYRFERIRIYT